MQYLVLLMMMVFLVSPKAALAHRLGDLLPWEELKARPWAPFLSLEGPERPVISFMLRHREALALTPEQVTSLEALRAEFEQEAIQRWADLQTAERELKALLQVEEVDLGKVEAKVREIEAMKAELRLSRIRTIERGKALLTPGQRAKLQALLKEPWWKVKRREWAWPRSPLLLFRDDP